MLTFAILGLGNRAKVYLDALNRIIPGAFTVVAIADIDEQKRTSYQAQYQIKEELVFTSYQEFMQQEKCADVLMITTLDDMHYEPVIDGIKKGYHIILEKPIAMTLEEVLIIEAEAKKQPDLLVGVCHVLRYTPFFQTLKSIIDSKELGNVVTIQHNENVGYYHFAHSYVRGNWRNRTVAAPFIVAKSCHDMDILLYLLGDKHAVRLSSMGSLSYFNHEHYDESKMAHRCVDCSLQHTCPYSALKIYRDVLASLPDDQHRLGMLQLSPYGRCVYDCDNDVADHQVTIIEFEQGITATFNLSAFTNTVHRSIKIMCELGEIRASEDNQEIEVTRFGEEMKKVISPIKNFFYSNQSGHSGGDDGFIQNFLLALQEKKQLSSSLQMSIESHVMAFLAEESRLENGKVQELDLFNKK